MGNDGGSIPTRRELVKTGPRAPTSSELKATAHESLAHSWAHCALTDVPIVPSADLPLAADYLGRIFSYEAVLTALATPAPDEHDGTPASATTTTASSSSSATATPPSNETPTLATVASFGIHTLRDIVRIHPAAPPKAANEDVWICPVSRKVLGAGTRAVYVVPCGHVFAEIALKEAGEESCPECGAAFGSVEDSVVLVLATGTEEVERARRRMERLRGRGLTHNLKKDRGGGGGRSNGEGEKKRKKKRKERDIDGEAPNGAVKARKVVKV